MGIAEIIILCLVGTLCIGILARVIYNKSKGKTSCSCSGNCSCCSACNKGKKQK